MSLEDDQRIPNSPLDSPFAGTVAPGSHAGKIILEHSAGCLIGSAPGDRMQHSAVCTGRADLGPECTRHPDGELFRLSAADRAFDSLFSVRREIIPRPPLADQCVKNLRTGADESLGCREIAVDNHVARSGCVAIDRPLRGCVDLHFAIAGIPSSLAKNAREPACFKAFGSGMIGPVGQSGAGG